MLAGFVAGEGSFVVTPRQPPRKDGTARLRFVFDVTVAARDRPMLEALRAVLGRGCITDQRAARAHWQPTCNFRIASITGHLSATVPWADAHLATSYKRRQYEAWRAELVAYAATHPRKPGRSRCSTPGCTEFVRGRGLCRRHYYRATGY
jgi:hypothetical protein